MAHRQNLQDNLTVQRTRVPMGRTRTVLKTSNTFALIAPQPLVAGLSANPELPAQSGNRPPSLKMSRDKAHSFIHHTGLLPNHGRTSRGGLTRPRKRRRRSPPQSLPFSPCRCPNDVWCVDFKGWFLTGDGIQVDPLTISDAHSRYLLCCEPVGRTVQAHVWPLFEAAFREFGLPKAVRSDNGPPFASRGAAGLSRLAVKLIKAGVLPERIAPGKPQQNGRHERMHLTLKQDTPSPPARSLAEQITRFRDFQQTYNHQRPHEALGQVPPARVYHVSPRVWDGVPRSPDYPDHADVRKVRSNGEIKWKSKTIFVTKALRGEPIGLYQIDDNAWHLKYGPILLGTLKGRDQWRRA